MLGKVVFILRAMQDGKLYPYHGRQLHGALFYELEGIDPAFSAKLHEVPDKPFAMTPLFRGGTISTWDDDIHEVKEGQYWNWRVSALTKDMLDHLGNIRCGSQFTVNDICWRIEQVCMRHDEHPEAGYASEQDLISMVMEEKPPRQVNFDYIVPASFRHNNFNYPWPVPDLIFGSLARRWLRLGLTPVLSDNEVQTYGKDILPSRWEGRTVQIFFDRKSQFPGFVGSFNYDLSMLTVEQKKQIRLLSRFASIAGAGRMTTHALGVISTKERD